MKYLKLFENYSDENRIKELFVEYQNSPDENPHNLDPIKLNEGHCEDIAWFVSDKCEFLNDDNIIDDGKFWSSDITEYPCKSEDEYWQIETMIDYGSDIEFGLEYLEDFDLTGHVWIYYNGKHYDVETQNGVTSFWDLPIFQRQLKSLGII
jgi:hypothetical protein